MGAIILSFQSSLGDAVHSQRDSARLTWFRCWKKADKSLEGDTFMPLLDYLKREI